MPTAMAVANCFSGALPAAAAPLPSTASPPIIFGRCSRGRRKARCQVLGVRSQDSGCGGTHLKNSNISRVPLSRGINAQTFVRFADLPPKPKLVSKRLRRRWLRTCSSPETFMKPVAAGRQGISTCQTVLLWLLCTHLQILTWAFILGIELVAYL